MCIRDRPTSQKSGIALLEETLDSFDKLVQDKNDQFNIVIDEFQEIVSFRDGAKIEALLRKHIQHYANCSCFFLGSKRRMLLDMFTQKERPFYRSSINLKLPPLPREAATEFIMRQFKAGGKECPFDTAQEITEITGGYPYYVQRLSYALFQASEHEDILPAELDTAVSRMLSGEESNYIGMEKELAPGQKPLLKALAAEPTASLFAAEYQQRHRLRSVSSIQNSIKKLESLDYIEKDEEGVFSICLLYTSPSPRDRQKSRMPSSA